MFFSAFWQGFILSVLIILKYVSWLASWDTQMLFRHSIVLLFFVLVLLLDFVGFLNSNHLHFPESSLSWTICYVWQFCPHWQFSMLGWLWQLSSCYFVKGYEREKVGMKDIWKQVILKSAVPNTFWNVCCYESMSSNSSYWWIFTTLLCYWFITVRKIQLLLYWQKCFKFMHCHS